MTLQGFFPALERRTLDLDTVWVVNEVGEIRTDDCHCPLSYQADTTPGVVCEARKSLKMSVEDASAVATAADYTTASVWMAKLLNACRLAESV